MTTKEKLIKEALTLPPREKAEMITLLIQSLDKPDSEIDELWETEAEDRIDAYEKGEIKSVLIEDVINKYKTRLF